MSRAEDAVMRLYEDAALRGDLSDAPAERLLKWAEDKLMALDESASDDASFTSGERAIYAIIKDMNRSVENAFSGMGGFSAYAAPPGEDPDEMALIEALIAAQDGETPALADTPDAAAIARDLGTAIVGAFGVMHPRSDAAVDADERPRSDDAPALDPDN